MPAGARSIHKPPDQSATAAADRSVPSPTPAPLTSPPARALRTSMTSPSASSDASASRHASETHSRGGATGLLGVITGMFRELERCRCQRSYTGESAQVSDSVWVGPTSGRAATVRGRCRDLSTRHPRLLPAILSGACCSRALQQGDSRLTSWHLRSGRRRRRQKIHSRSNKNLAVT